MKYKNYFCIFIIFTLFFSCRSVPIEGEYKNVSYENLVDKHGVPDFDKIFINMATIYTL
jgi:hypothetical protein